MTDIIRNVTCPRCTLSMTCRYDITASSVQKKECPRCSNVFYFNIESSKRLDDFGRNYTCHL